MMAMSDATPATRLWEREESKVVRPFKDANDYLQDASFRLYSDSDYVQHPVIQVDSIDRARIAPGVQIAATPPEFEEIVGAPLKELTLIVAIEDRVFKNTTVIHSVNLALVEAGSIELPDSARECSSWAGDTRVHVAVVLSKNRKAAVGLAQRAGNWVSKKTFSVTRLRDQSSFSITPVDEEWFKNRGLPASTTYFVEMLSTDLNQPCENMPDLVKVYMNQGVVAALARDEESPLSKALIRNVYVDVAASILTIGFNNLEGEVTKDSVLDVVTSKLTKATGVPLAKLAVFAKDNSGTQLQTVIQAEAELTRAMITGLGRRMA